MSVENWKKLAQKGEMPSPRSGHSISPIGTNGVQFLMYGGIEANKNGKIGPNSDIYVMKLGGMQLTCDWLLEKATGIEIPLARTQHIAISIPPNNDRIFVYGGHHSPQARLNDTWFLNVKDFEWVRVGSDKPTLNNGESSIGAPPARANAGACLHENKIYIFGGHGGLSYQRIAFNDLHAFDLETETWEKIIPVNSPPDGRGGHSCFANNNKIYVYGGWNTEMQYDNITLFDLDKKEWFEPDIFNPIPRWNHSSILVPAIPTQKFFIFGGECAEYNEGSARKFGQYVNSSCYLDLGILHWVTFASDPNVELCLPSPREYAAMTYSKRERILLVHGGWNNGWQNDLYALSISKIVGPDYAITSIDPPLGQLSGGVHLEIKGLGFREDGIKVIFTPGSHRVDAPSKFSCEVVGKCEGEDLITCETPSFENHGPKECVVQVCIGSDDLTTTFLPFQYFLNTRASKSLAFGPGLLQDALIGAPVEFQIIARNDLGENRTSGRDQFEIKVVQKLPIIEEEKPEVEDEDKEGEDAKEGEEGKEAKEGKEGKEGEVAPVVVKKERFNIINIPCEVTDNQNGCYGCCYTVENEGEVEVTINFLDDKGKMVPIRGCPYKPNFVNKGVAKDNLMTGTLMDKYIKKELENIQNNLTDTKKQINTKDKDLTDVKALLNIKEKVEVTQNKTDQITLEIDQLDESLKLFQVHKIHKESQIKSLVKINKEWVDVKKICKDTKKEITPMVQMENEKNKQNIKQLEDDITQFTQEMKRREFFQYKCGTQIALQRLDNVFDELKIFEDKIDDYGNNAQKFGCGDLIQKAIKDIETIKIIIDNMKILWDHIDACVKVFEKFFLNKWITTEPFVMEDEVKKLFKTLKEMKVEKKANAYQGINEEIKKWLIFLPMIADLADQSMRPRHWDQIKEKVKKDFTIDENLLLKDIYDLNLGDVLEDVEEITDQARQESKMENTLKNLEVTWKDIDFDFRAHADVFLIGLNEDNFNMLEENQVSVTSMFSSRYLSTFEEKVVYWQRSLSAIGDVVINIGEVQRSWSFLESLFIHSAEVKKELPEKSILFIGIDKDVREILATGYKVKKALDFSTLPDLLTKLEKVTAELYECEKALNEFMKSKQMSFPRFFFVAQADLLDILSNGNNPVKVMVHMPKIISAMDNLELLDEGVRPFAKGMHACVGKEYVEFTEPLKLVGKVEVYLQEVIDTMRGSLKDISLASLKKFTQIAKEDWIVQDPAQVTLLINNCSWVINCEEGFVKRETNKDSIKSVFDKQIVDLQGLIGMVQGDLTKPVRMKIMCLITMDAHSRDIIDQLVTEEVARSDHFLWQTQLKGMFDQGKNDFVFKIADAVLDYGYEYLGNGPRLVITPLTDRIYVTATQALHLKMGCAPAGPAGTGKTESTKDLAAALGKACYVFNCSDQMNFNGMAGIFMGLAASGSWGCFDEFNRLVPEVLSVCSVQFKSVTDAIRAQKTRFSIQGNEISLDPTCGVFITMNPGYLGRSELPEGLKALFRPITVVVPNLEMICENMLMAEGFVTSKNLAKKFTTLYFLCKDLLSKLALHYDWGLRAIKSVLVVAGQMKRADFQLQEEAILLRALRDFNTPKIIADDLPIFMGLLGDLFPGVIVERKRDQKFEAIIEDCIRDAGLFEDDEFIKKVVQLGELLEIRHCVFVMGPPGAGKSSTWKMLGKAQDKDGRKTTIRDINPKVTSTNEFYGLVLLATKEWQDGLMSKTMRDLGQIPDDKPKWIVLDGDLDANWIESMNSVMDDNKLLTLSSNERIPLKAHMKLIFEIRDLRFATPATVSRAGILFISDSAGTQWKAYVKSWIKKLKCQEERKLDLQNLFDKYVPETFLHCIKYLKHVVPQVEISMVSSMCKLIESILSSNNVQVLEQVFVFACIWCIGGGFIEKEGKDYKQEFSNWWKDKWKSVKFQSKGTVFDYYVDIPNSKLEDWSKMTTQDVVSTIDTTKSIQSYTIPTVNTISANFLLKSFIKINHCSMLVGMAGCGKTQIIKGLLNEMVESGQDYLQQIINLNFYSDANLLQLNMEQQLVKQTGTLFAPPGKYKLIYFVDDLNMPARDPYETQTAIALLRQHRDYEHWYDKKKLMKKDVKNTQLISAMNPNSGSFIINPRLQRHFWTLAVGFPAQSALQTIYSAYLTKHFSKFKASFSEWVVPIIKGTLQLHAEVEMKFRKTAQNFHYEFNVRHLTNVFQGLLTAKPEIIKEPDNMVKLWIHEAERIYGDRLVNAEHLATYRAFTAELVAKSFSKFNLKKYFGATPEPLIFANFVASLDEKNYDQFPSAEAMSKRLLEALREYNDTNAVMDLVLFDDAMKHCCKISRIIAGDQGHALLVGVGGSGKQSLARLSSFICSFITVGILISSTYNMNDLKTDLQGFYMKAGVKDEGVMFLFTEGQITNERFLVYINDLLSSGEIADLFAAEDVDGIVNNIRPAVKSEGILDSKDNCWKFFIDRIKKNLHMALCFSPVGESFRNRAKKFPAIINSTVIDWFHAWPQDALLSVASKFLAEVEMDTEEIRTGIENFMPYSFNVVDKYSKIILEQERRNVYTTPKSFLELIKLFRTMYDKKKGDLQDNKDKYELGVVKLTETGEIVAKLEEDLKIMAVEVEAKKKAADEQAEIVGKEKTTVDAENSIAEAEADKCAKIKASVESIMAKAQYELAAAIPAVEAAQQALDKLSIDDFRMLKAFKKPHPDVEMCCTAVLHLFSKIHPDIPTDPKGNLKTDKPWQITLNLLKDPNVYLKELLGFKERIDNREVPLNNFKNIRPTLDQETFTVESLGNKSSACAGLCEWVCNITIYYDIFMGVEPLKESERQAKIDLANANEKKAIVDTKVNDLNAALKLLTDQFDTAMASKNQAILDADKCEKKLNLAQRLVNALGSEQERWNQSIIDLEEYLKVIIGDVLLASAFVSYIGPFNKQFRDMIIKDNFIVFFAKNNIPISPSANPLLVLTDDATVASWNNCGLPPDRVSTENGAILTNSERYSLIIDPQLQGYTWLRKTWDDKNLQVTRLSNPKMAKTIEFAVEGGQPVLIENMGDSVDAVIQPIYSRAIIKKGKTKYIKLGDKELTLNPTFNLFMHTKLSNPHYPPEIQAECCLINFTVTEAGLEDQLLSLVVKKERPDLSAQKEDLIQQQNGFKIKLKELESGLLKQLAEAEGDILEDIALIENLEYSKALSSEIKEKVEIAIVTEQNINEASEAYRPAASRGALVFFLLNELYKIHSFYRFSLDSYVIVVKRSIDLVSEADKKKKNIGAGGADEVEVEKVEGEEVTNAEAVQAAEAAAAEEAEAEEEIPEMTPRTLIKRVDDLTESITFQSFNYSRRGTLEKDKLIISTMLTFRIMIRNGLISQDEYDALVKKEIALEPPHQIENLKWIPEAAWAAVKGLDQIKTFEHLIPQMESESHLWRKWYVDERPETVELPKSVKEISLFHRILLLRAMRPDRLCNALIEFVGENMGKQYVDSPPFDIVDTYDEMNTQTPVFFVLFPGVDPTKDVEKIGQMKGKTEENQKFINISMGQGQELSSIKTLKEAGKVGNWVMFQNVHLMQDWMKDFERNLEIVLDEGAHEDFRCFISSEPPPLPEMEIIPESILQNSLKVANEAATDLKSNIIKAFSKFDESDFERAKSHKFPEYKALLFGLCVFHSLILGRRKFGPQGWSKKYSFNDGDLTICGSILHNYLSGYEQVPYADLRYLYGDVMYGGHITDDWDRRTNSTYLLKLIRPDILAKMPLTMGHGFRSPDPNKFDRNEYFNYIETDLPPEDPRMFGLHPNAEIGYLTSLGENLFGTILACAGGSGGGGGSGKDAVIKVMIARVFESLPQPYIMIELVMKAKENTAFQIVCIQECERMNALTFTIRKSLEDLDAGLKGQLNITDEMEDLGKNIFLNKQPAAWVVAAYFSLKDLATWYDDLLLRIAQLDEYSEELIAPKSTWISGLFNPMSFLTAVMQTTARRDLLPLDQMTLKTEVLNIRDYSTITEPPVNGSYIHGFFLQGASWENGRGEEQGNLTEMVPKELYPELPVVHVTSILRENKVETGFYDCPVYVTSMRGPTYVFSAGIKMESEDTDDKLWILAGVALLMAPE